MTDRIYDTVIIGGGPAGYTAALYASRSGLDTLVLEKLAAGGQMALTSQVDNYPGFCDGIDGPSLGAAMQQGAERFGARTIRTEVLSAELSENPKTISTENGGYLSRTVIIATGAKHRPLGIEHEQELVGRGLGYCAVCDGMFYRGKTAAVVGGGNSAVSDAIYLSRICKKVYLIHRRDKLRADRIYHEPLFAAKNVELKWNSEISELIFDEKLRGVRLMNKSGETEEIAVDGLFISIGMAPASEPFADQLRLDRFGYIVADESTKTSLDGVFTAGDVRTKLLRQIVTAAADGAVAAYFAEEYITSHRHS